MTFQRCQAIALIQMISSGFSTRPFACMYFINAGLPALEDAALAVVVAQLPRLRSLNVGYTGAGDATLGAITYVHRAAAWAKEYGVPLPSS